VKRRLFNLAAAVSLVLMLATVTLWVRSYSRLSVERGDSTIFAADDGKLYFLGNRRHAQGVSLRMIQR
jgi:hypothetical protein